MTSWDVTTIGRASLVVTKGTTPTSIGRTFTQSGIPFVKVESIQTDGLVDLRKTAFIDEETHRALSRSALQVDDILFTIAGTIGRAAQVTADVTPGNTNQAVAIIRPDRRVVEPRFVLYCLRDKQRVQKAQSRVVQSVQANLSLSELRAVEIPLPSLQEQRAIASVLGALDDKIAVNERITATADELSGSLFRRAVLHSPDQSTARPLSETSEFVNGRAFTKDSTGTGRMVVRIAEINSGPGSSTVYNDIDVPEKHLARPGDVLFAWSGSLTVARWFRPEAIINQHIFKCIPKNGYPQWLVSQLVHRKIDEFRAIAADKATTMGHIQRKHLDEPVHVPAPGALRTLNAEIGPLWDRALVAEQESLTLAALRDTLLPQLMSGRLRVRDAEKTVEDHA
ncbi:restriction endonuclease subunit S [Streptomyces sp. AP-93]|uniref:restriction endonuclease subunit S n=1 Tax=Streptomyces sp. AP-93 TaxID=2929048 RepID=UPI001FAF3326|nr:restriction endonuclease subunit S [Streptomyces sp. AP-93]MCJ0871146.1 restriction endonuclease subunit S [Streptomyces sp. AP-93]